MKRMALVLALTLVAASPLMADEQETAAKVQATIEQVNEEQADDQEKKEPQLVFDCDKENADALASYPKKRYCRRCKASNA